MGRKSIDRQRKPLTDKAKKWVRELTPLLQEVDLRKLTLDELSEMAGKSRSTIYTYFSTKEEVYLTITHFVLEDLRSAISPETLAQNNMEEALSHLLHSIGKGIEGISISYLEQLQNHFPEIWAVIQEFTDQVLSLLSTLYQMGMDQGHFKSFNVSLLTALDSHFVMSIMTDTAQFKEQGLTLRDLVTEYLELRLGALSRD
jgi:AcrR family transcriptional regulator